MVQGLHVGQDNPFPLPILPIHGETTQDIAMQVDMGFKILALVTLPSGKRRMKTVQEFGDALTSYLGRRSDRTTLEYEKFQQSLDRLASS
ncbi:hypothetical protein AAFF_G00009670 [Aldrovandia affinis]|uniref:Uncharacterized protein n=1 Tax=Aldrovandia affinis TaxID=143900 RepID=A0AAD7S796_9TELE|nr:hypothetical protein AAFF_G00009670 [Aldrovandia affinis]